MLGKLSDINRTQKCCISVGKILSRCPPETQLCFPQSVLHKVLTSFCLQRSISISCVNKAAAAPGLQNRLGVRAPLSRDRGWSQALAELGYFIGLYPFWKLECQARRNRGVGAECEGRNHPKNAWKYLGNACTFQDSADVWHFFVGTSYGRWDFCSVSKILGLRGLKGDKFKQCGECAGIKTKT